MYEYIHWQITIQTCPEILTRAPLHRPPWLRCHRSGCHGNHRGRPRPPAPGRHSGLGGHCAQVRLQAVLADNIHPLADLDLPRLVAPLQQLVGASVLVGLQCAVDPLHHAICLGVVGRGGDVLDPLLLTPVSPCTRGELGPPVGGDASWHAKAGHPLGDECLQHCVHVNVA